MLRLYRYGKSRTAFSEICVPKNGGITERTDGSWRSPNADFTDPHSILHSKRRVASGANAQRVKP